MPDAARFDVTAPALIGAFAQAAGTAALGRALTNPFRLALGLSVSRATMRARRASALPCASTIPHVYPGRRRPCLLLAGHAGMHEASNGECWGDWPIAEHVARARAVSR